MNGLQAERIINELETEAGKWHDMFEELEFAYGQLENYCSGLELEIERKDARIAELKARVASLEAEFGMAR